MFAPPMHETAFANPHGSETTTNGVRVIVAPRYMPEHSCPDDDQFVFAYRIRIVNEGDESVQLISRRWRIIDANGAEDVVEGDGVVGRMPLLRPGDGFEYESYCPLRTEWGTMEGSFRMNLDDGAPLDVQIERFYLVQP